jgi:hypothetical protein
MIKDTLNSTDELLESVMDDIDDPDLLYELRSARQLLELAKQRHKDHYEAIEEMVDTEEIPNNSLTRDTDGESR